MRLSTLFLLLFISLLAPAQSNKIKKLEANAAMYFDELDYHHAHEAYYELDSLVPNTPLYLFRLGVTGFYSDNKKKYLETFKKAQQLGFRDPLVEFYLGWSHHIRHDFDKAEMHYKIYRASLDSVRNKVEYQKVKDHILQIETAKYLVANAVKMKVEPLGNEINSEYNDYAPLIAGEDSILIFTSRRPNTTGGRKDYLTGEYFEDVYASFFIEDQGKWTFPASLSDNINTKNHDAALSISDDGKTLLTYQGNKQAKLKGDIYISYLQNDEWTKPEKMPSPINSQYWEPSASLSADGKIIYFSSNRPGGFGGLDLYKSELQENGKWSDAVNLGPMINTDLDEDAPFMHAEGHTLFFSSKAHKTMGGYDVFYSEFDEEKEEWSYPENLGYPINTADDDLFFTWTHYGRKGYFSTDRANEKGKKDIYVAYRPTEPGHILVDLYIQDDVEGGPVEANVIISDSETKALMGVYHTDTTGLVEASLPVGHKYEYAVEAEGYILHKDTFNLPKTVAYYEVEKEVKIVSYQNKKEHPVTLPEDESPVTQVAPNDNKFKFQPGNTIVFRNILFDFDKAKLREESTADLNKMVEIMRNHPEIVVELSGHTDSIGADKYNYRLSRNRAKVVAKYLVKNGIDKKSLVAVGYGETRPFTSNQTAQGRQLNRRTEFKVISVTDIQQYGEELIDLENILSYDGNNNTFKPYNDDVIVQTSEYVPSGEVLGVKAHFPFSVYDHITLYSQERLKVLIKQLNDHPNMRLRIHAHADPLGDTEYNKFISSQRAKVVFQYLIDNGISPNRLEVAAYGGNFPVLKTNSYHENVVNRRVEFEVIAR